MRISQEQAISDEANESNGVFSISAASVLYPLVSFVFRLLKTIFTRLAVVVLFGLGGLAAGTVIGLPTGPGVAITAAVGGAVGILIGGWWEFRRLEAGVEYDDYLE